MHLLCGPLLNYVITLAILIRCSQFFRRCKGIEEPYITNEGFLKKSEKKYLKNEEEKLQLSKFVSFILKMHISNCLHHS